MSDERREEVVPVPSDVLRVLRIVHVAMLATIMAYLGLLVMITRPPADPLHAASLASRAVPGPVMTWVTAGVAACLLIAIAVLQRRIAGQRTFTMAVICWALAEGIAICGLVLGMVHLDVGHFLPFAGVSMVALLLLTPRQSWLSRKPDPRLYQQ